MPALAAKRKAPPKRAQLGCRPIEEEGTSLSGIPHEVQIGSKKGPLAPAKGVGVLDVVNATPSRVDIARAARPWDREPRARYIMAMLSLFAG